MAAVGTEADREGPLHPGAPHQEWQEGGRLEGWDAAALPVRLPLLPEGVARDVSELVAAPAAGNNTPNGDASRCPPHFRPAAMVHETVAAADGRPAVRRVEVLGWQDEHRPAGPRDVHLGSLCAGLGDIVGDVVVVAETARCDVSRILRKV